MTTRRVAVGAGLVAVVVVAVLGWVFLAKDNPDSEAPLSDGAASRIENALVSSDGDEIRQVLDPTVAGALEEDSSPLLPKGSRLELAPEESKSPAEGLLDVPGTVSGEKPGRWIIRLIREDSKWLVYAVMPDEAKS